MDYFIKVDDQGNIIKYFDERWVRNLLKYEKFSQLQKDEKSYEPSKNESKGMKGK